MDLSEAKMVLETDSDDPELIRDHYEEKVFAQLSVFYRDPVVPSLFRARIKKISLLDEALQVLVPSSTFAQCNKLPLANPDQKLWKELLLIYEANKAAVRKEIRADVGINGLSVLVEQLIANEQKYAQLLLVATRHLSEGSSVKITEAVPVVNLINELSHLEKKGMIDSQLASLSQIDGKIPIFNLLKEVNRLRKISQDG